MADGFVMYRSFVDALELLTDEEYGAATRAINRYAIYGEEPGELSRMAQMVFIMARPQIDANNDRRENGKKGGRPPKAEKETIGFTKEETIGFDKKETIGFEKEKTIGFENQKPLVLKNDENKKPKEKEKDNNKDKEKEKENKEKEKKRNSIFAQPTLEEVKAYCKERNSNVDPVQFYNYFSEGDWVDSKGQKVRNWKQKLLTWEKFNAGGRDSPKKAIHNFEERDYDFDDLERRFAKN